jgi:acyl-CoA thioester hydrolase
MQEHTLGIKVYLEDTDAEGIVYHANYLKYFERARSEILEARGVPLAEMNTRRRLFVVHEMHIKFQRPARLGDELEVRSSYQRASDYRVTFHQSAHRPGESSPLVSAEVQVVCVDPEGNLKDLPEGIF